MKLFKGNVLVQRYLKGECKTDSEKLKVKETVDEWRLRLSDISWFMRCLNESIAHMANKEDNCTGRFWEGRFKSQALLNEQALLSCMAYVDLNPIRAGLADSVDSSEFTSIEQRIRESNFECLIVNDELKSKKTKDKEEIDHFTPLLTSPLAKSRLPEEKEIKGEGCVSLADFVGSKESDGIPYLLMDYLELVDWTGRSIRDDKAGFIPSSEPKILNKLGFTADIWMKSVGQFSDHFYSHIGSEDQLKAVCGKTEIKWLAGTKICRSIYKN
jgi:hypothetical protein